MSRRLIVALVFLAFAAVSAPAFAQEPLRLDLSTAVSNSAPAAGTLADQLQIPRNNEFNAGPKRSTLMTSLYISTAAMQALDVHSTLRALDHGAVEGNPLMENVTRNKVAFVALKAGVAFSTVMAARNMSKRNKVAAVLTLVAINSAYALIVNHNYRVGGR